MKTKLKFILACCIFSAYIMTMDGCKKKDSTVTVPTPPPCTVSGTNVNIGSTAGGAFSQNVATVSGYDPTCTFCVQNYPIGGSHTDGIWFDNTSLNFSIGETSSTPCSCGGLGGSTIMDVGAQTCLDFTYSGTPTASTVAYKNGDGYVGKFTDGHIVKFIAGAYNSGWASITYIFQ